ncbi:MAG TPA: allophanate hydrolase [Candidatus Dormibacteraeota bacterium]|nr:allophanate hydrolase [Candidatus Dormibacteraeota bacterium]
MNSVSNFSAAIEALYDRLLAEPLDPVWLSLVPRDAALARAREIENHPTWPLAGSTFAVKDNFDVAGMQTTAGCPAYARIPEATATVVRRLSDAGALLIGKTNMDQFATGLVGTRSPYGACSSVFDPHYISGGSSSGSAVAVAKKLVTFSLGTDTAGSGRVPAAFNGLIGLKPTRGLLSAQGVVPACRTLDCVSIFATNCQDACGVWRAARGFDSADPFSRERCPGEGAAPWLHSNIRFGVPAPEQLEFFGDDEAARLYQAAIEKLQRIGAEKIEIDFAPFRQAAALLYGGAWVAERLAAIKDFFAAHASEMNPVVQGIIGGAARYSAVAAFEGEYRLRELCSEAGKQWKQMDVLVLPTTGTIYTHEQIAADPVKLNTNLGYYTNFVNLMDLAAVAIPAGFRPNGLPFGISFIGPAFTDEALLAFADRYLGGSTPLLQNCPGCVEIAVVGAHLTGQPLNWQMTERSARRVRTGRTAADYRLFALSDGVPAKPGLMRDRGFHGPGIEVEVWAMPEDRFGTFVAAIPPPLGIGTITLDSGESVKCFLCEPYALSGATEITHFGGWRAYLASSKS